MTKTSLKIAFCTTALVALAAASVPFAAQAQSLPGGTTDTTTGAVCNQDSGNANVACANGSAIAGARGTVIGNSATGQGQGATALGYGSAALNDSTVALGQSSSASGTADIAIGSIANAGSIVQNDGTLIPTGTAGNIAIGSHSGSAHGVGSSNALSTTANGGDSIAIGTATQSLGASGVAIGANATVFGAGAVNGNVALGANSSDGGEAGRDVVSVGCAANCTAYGQAVAPFTRAVTNVSNGTLSSTSTDAVTGQQLYATNQALAAQQNEIKALQSTTANLQTQIDSTRFDLAQLRREARAGIAGSDALNGIPQAVRPGQTVIGVGVSQYAGYYGFAGGISTALKDGRTVLRLGVAGASEGAPVHVSGGAGFSF